MQLQSQFDALSRAIVEEHRAVFAKQDLGCIEALMRDILAASRIFVMGAGREGISLRAFAMRLSHLGKPTHWIWDDTTPAMGKGDLFILSDGRADIGMFRYILDQAKKTGAKIALFTGCPDGPAAKTYADTVVFIPAKVYLGDEPRAVQTVQPMGNLYEQHLYLLCDLIVILTKDAMGLDYDDMEARHRNIE